MTVLRSAVALGALIVLVACSATPTGAMPVRVCASWADDGNPAPSGPFGFSVAAGGAVASVDLAVGACADLGPYAAGTDVTITQNVPDGLIVVLIERVGRGSGADQSVVQPATPSTTFGVDAFERVVFGNAVRVDSAVAIDSVASSATDLPVDPTAVAGSIDVVVAVDPGNDGLRLLEAFVGDEKVFEQVFEPATPADAPPFDVAFGVATNAYTVAGGVATVAFPNGAYELVVRLRTSEGGASAPVQDQTDLTFANADTVDVDVEAGATALDASDLEWLGQGLTARFAYVAYGGASASEFEASYAGLLRTTNPAVWTASNLAGFNSTDAGADLTVTSTGAGTASATVSLRYDGVAPAVGTAGGLAGDVVLTEQAVDGLQRCCSSNWVNPGYAFADGAPSASDVVGGVAGVGGLTTTYHAGPASLTNLELAALDAAATPGAAGLTATAVNTTYSVVARVADALGNVALQRLVANGGNPATTFGVDDSVPTGQALLLGSVEDRTVYNANVPGFGPFAAGTISMNAADDVGFGAAAVATSFRFSNAADGVACLVGATAACTPTQQSPVFATDNTDVYPGAGAVTQGYYQYRGQAYDQAGNGSGTIDVVTYLFDETLPSVDNIAGVAGSFLPGQSYAFSANAADNVDLKQSEFAFVFPGLTGTNLDAIPMAAPQSLGTPWDFENPTSSAPVSAAVPFVTGVEPTDGAGSPSGVLVPVRAARFLVWDVAENQSTQENTFAIGSSPAPVSFGAGASPIVPAGASFQQVTQAATLCFDADAPCVAPAVRSVTLTATATGPAGTFANPFARVMFAYVDNVDVGGGEFSHRFIGIDGTATFQDVGPTRTWVWSITLDAEDLVLDPAGLNYVLPVQVLGINDGTGTALLAVTGTAITVIDN